MSVICFTTDDGLVRLKSILYLNQKESFILYYIYKTNQNKISFILHGIFLHYYRLMQ